MRKKKKEKKKIRVFVNGSRWCVTRAEAEFIPVSRDFQMPQPLPHLSLAGCYAKNFGPKGFGYGQGAGALVHAQ